MTTDQDVLRRIHDILFGSEAYRKDYEQFYVEVGAEIISWAATFFQKEMKTE